MNKKDTAELKGLLATTAEVVQVWQQAASSEAGAATGADVTAPDVQAKTTATPVWQRDAIDAVINFVTSETLEITAGEQLRRVFGPMVDNKINLPYVEAEARRVFVVQTLRKEKPSLTDESARQSFSRLFKAAYDIQASTALPRAENVKAVEAADKRKELDQKAAPLAKQFTEQELGDQVLAAKTKQVAISKATKPEVKKAIAEEVKVAERALALMKATADAEEAALVKAGREASKTWTGQQWKLAMEAIAEAG